MTDTIDAAAVTLVDDHLAQLAASLGPDDATTHDMLDELRDGLLARVEALGTDGLPPQAGARLALREFGGLQQVAPVLMADVMMTRARTVAVTMLRFAPTAAVVWAIALLTGAPTTAGAPPLIAAMAWLGPGCVCAAVAALTAYRAASRLDAPRPRMARAAAAAAAVACAVTDLAAVAYIAAWAFTGIVAWPALAAALVSGVRIVVVGRSAPRLLVPARI